MIAPAPSIGIHAALSNNVAAISMSTALAGASIYYTTDGTTPTAASTLYAAAFNIYLTTTIKAVTVKAGYTDSDACTAVVTIETAPSSTTPIIDSILDNMADTLALMSTATGYHSNIGLATREGIDWPALQLEDFPAAMVFNIVERDDETGATEQNVEAKVTVIVRGGIYTTVEADRKTAINNFMQDIEKIIMVDGTRGGHALSTVIKEKLPYNDEIQYVGVFDITFEVTYLYKHGQP